MLSGSAPDALTIGWANRAPRVSEVPNDSDLFDTGFAVLTQVLLSEATEPDPLPTGVI